MYNYSGFIACTLFIALLIFIFSVLLFLKEIYSQRTVREYYEKENKEYPDINVDRTYDDFLRDGTAKGFVRDGIILRKQKDIVVQYVISDSNNTFYKATAAVSGEWILTALVEEAAVFDSKISALDFIQTSQSVGVVMYFKPIEKSKITNDYKFN